jgi:hypothetical protein
MANSADGVIILGVEEKSAVPSVNARHGLGIASRRWHGICSSRAMGGPTRPPAGHLLDRRGCPLGDEWPKESQRPFSLLPARGPLTCTSFSSGGRI